MATGLFALSAVTVVSPGGSDRGDSTLSHGSRSRLLDLKNGDLVDDPDAEPLERHNLARAIGEQPNRAQAEVGKNLGADA